MSGELLHQAYRFELDPSRAQRHAFVRYAGVRRWAYNWGLEQSERDYAQTDKRPSVIELRRRLTRLKQAPEYAWLRDVSSKVPECALADLDDAFEAFFTGRRRYPRFKRKRRCQERFRLRGAMKTEPNRVWLPTIGWVRTKEQISSIKGRILSATVKQEADRWYVSLNVERGPKQPVAPATSRPVGVDLGVARLAAVASGDGEVAAVADPVRALRELERRIARVERAKARKQRGSANRRKAALRVARLHRRAANARRDQLHKLTTKLAKSRSVIVIEDLNVREMGASARGSLENPGRNVRQKAGQNKALRDHAFGEIRRQLEYKTAWYGSSLLVADRFYPSSKTCSRCQAKNHGLKRDDRVFACPACGLVLDRDVNAAINLARLAPVLLEANTSPTARPAESNACGEDGSGPALASWRVKPASKDPARWEGSKKGDHSPSGTPRGLHAAPSRHAREDVSSQRDDAPVRLRGEGRGREPGRRRRRPVRAGRVPPPR